MLVDLGPDFQTKSSTPTHIVRVRVEELGQADERYIDEIQIVLVTNGGPRWLAITTLHVLAWTFLPI